MSNKDKNLYQRLNGLMAEVTSVFKGTEVSMGGGRGYSAVSHDDVTKLIHMPMVNNGIFIELSVVSSKLTPQEQVSEYNGKQQIKLSYLAEVTVRATFVNVDNANERFSVDSYAYALDSGDKAVGKAISMATKYVYLKNLLLESTDEEESRDFEKKEPKAAPQRSVSVPKLEVSGVTRIDPAPKKVEVPVASTESRGSFRKNPPATTIPSGDL
jgi:hypothetical protein